MNKEYLKKWIEQHYQELCETDWYENNFNGDTMETITPEFFYKTYLVPTIERAIEKDFYGSVLDVEQLFTVK